MRQLEPSATKNVTRVVIEVGVRLLVTVDTRGALDRIEMVTFLPFDDAVLLSEKHSAQVFMSRGCMHGASRFFSADRGCDLARCKVVHVILLVYTQAGTGQLQNHQLRERSDGWSAIIAASSSSGTSCLDTSDVRSPGNGTGERSGYYGPSYQMCWYTGEKP